MALVLLAKMLYNVHEATRQPYPRDGFRIATFRDPVGNVIGVWWRSSR
jgi:hypothetical protein